VGFFLSSLVAGAAVVSNNGSAYRYDAGVYYQPVAGGYRVVRPPIGAIVFSLPQDRMSMFIGGVPYNYYGGAFYIRAGGGYQVVRAPAGAIVYNLPDGCTSINANGTIYLQYNGDFYLPIQDANGQPAYEVVNVE
jgi:hypothetical protein